MTFEQELAAAAETLAEKHKLLGPGDRLEITFDVVSVDKVTVVRSGSHQAQDDGIQYLPSLRVWVNEIIIRETGISGRLENFVHNFLSPKRDESDLDNDDFPPGSMRWLVNMSEQRVLKFRTIGKKTLKELREVLEKHGLSLGMHETQIIRYEKAAAKVAS